jgi:NADPH-dependent curcumin reductase CurA
MSAEINRRWLIAARPIGRAVAESDFTLDSQPVVAPAEGEVLLRTRMFGFDPSQKAWMSNMAPYTQPVEIGGVMLGRGIAEVIESRSPAFAPGDRVRGYLGWQEYPVVQAGKLEKLPDEVPDGLALGLWGSTGRTAYFGLLHVGCPKPGDVLVVSGAAGAVGSVVGQLGKLSGCRVIGIAGGPEKCRRLVEELGFDAAIDYKAEDVGARLRALCSSGIDIYFDNVGGPLLETALNQITFGARIVICGGISTYSMDLRSPENIPPGPRNYLIITTKGASILGFLVHQFAEHNATASARLLRWWQEGKLKQLEDVQQGFENAPRTFMRLFEGRNFGKQLLRVGE